MRILRVNNDVCELVEIGDGLEDLHAEVKGYIEIVPLGATLCMVVNEEGLFSNFRFNRPATQLYKSLGVDNMIMGPAFLCSFSDVNNLVSLTDEDYEIAAKVLRSYGFVKGD